ncbi:MAG: hypothetical protein KDB88_12160, partial [Flavobacteriales bacterium]|nr:hypothetical protein [Flavobacteriales bacterium]
MKHITLCAALICAAHADAQNLFTSSFESWSGATPDGWVGDKTTLENDSIQQADQNIMFGSYAVRLVNTESGHKRFTTTQLTVEDGQAYNISFYARGAGEIRTGLFDGRSTGSGYATYNVYNVVNGSTWTPYTQQVVAANDTTGAEFILSVRNTMAGMGHLEVDSVRISLAVPTPPTDATIYDIQFTTDPNGDSPLLGTSVNTGGSVTAVASNGYWIQSGSGPWSGIFVFDFDHVPTRGDSLTLTGVVDEFNGLTELKTITNFSVVNNGNSVAPEWLATGDAGQEQWEGVLAQVTMADCTAPADGNGEWTVDDGTGPLQVNDVMYAFMPN